MIELFDDVAASAAALFRARCTGNGGDTEAASFARTKVHKILRGASFFGGRVASRWVDEH